MSRAASDRRRGILCRISTALGVVALLSLAPAPPIGATPGDVGYLDGSTAGAGAAASGEKPESKLWWNAGSWWGSLFDSTSQQYHVFRLDRATQTWQDTGTALDNRPNTRADTLWDGSHLYVSSHVTAASNTAASAGKPARLYRLSYAPAAGTYTVDAGFPVPINDVSSETLTIDKDSTGTLWATWTQVGGNSTNGFTNTVYVNATTGSDDSWGTPFAMPTAGANPAPDDISAVVAYGGNKVGVMWSNQIDETVYWAVHVDGTAERLAYCPSPPRHQAGRRPLEPQSHPGRPSRARLRRGQDQR